jgi:hypothetical protein
LVTTAVFAETLPLLARTAFVGGAVVLVWLLVTFSRLTVEITHEIRVFFGRGWPRRTVDPAQVTGERVVRGSPWHGWGIRWIPHGWLWNVWGLDAVELNLVSGKVLRVGTDEPEALLAAVRSVTGR